MQTTTSKPHVVLLASPGMGHLIPIIELGNRLIAHHGINVTVFVVAADPSISDSLLIRQSPATLNIVVLPQVDISALVSPTASPVAHMVVMVRESVPLLRSAFSSMDTPPTALVVDLFGREALILAHEFNMLKYVFVLSTAWCLAIFVHLPSLGEKEKHDHGFLKKPLEIPGCRAPTFEETSGFNLDQPDPYVFHEFACLGNEIMMTDGVLVNTWQELEPSTLNELRHNKSLGRATKVPIYPIGPLVRPVQPCSEGEVISWLDKQPKESVVYVSFGSGGTLSMKQTIELAWGLELSRVRFIWVVRPPLDTDAMGSYFNSNGKLQDCSLGYLPEGFLSRTQDVGLIVPMWAPQTEILAHGSISAFLSHCGWNSTLESMVNVVPMITWPLYAKQKMNATLLVEEFGLAVRLGHGNPEVIIEREEIKETIVEAMNHTAGKGCQIKFKAKELKDKGQEALAKGGSSYNSLSQMAKECELRSKHQLNDTTLPGA